MSPLVALIGGDDAPTREHHDREEGAHRSQTDQHMRHAFDSTPAHRHKGAAMPDHFLTHAKAYAALIGSVATALLGIYTSGPVWQALTVVLAVATAVGTYAVPNKPASRPRA